MSLSGLLSSTLTCESSSSDWVVVGGAALLVVTACVTVHSGGGAQPDSVLESIKSLGFWGCQRIN